MQPGRAARVGYVLKMYPRLSETFIVNEILAHEAAGMKLEIFSLRPPVDGRFHEAIGRVQANVTYLPYTRLRASEFWRVLCATAKLMPSIWRDLAIAESDDQNDVYQALLLARMIRERGITHLHAHFGSLATTVARLASVFTGVSYSFTAHAKDIFHEDVDRQLLRRKLHDAAAVITVSDFNLQFLREEFGEDAQRVRRIYNGLDLSEFRYEPSANRDPMLLGVGRLVEKKGFDVLIDACAELVRRGRRFRCEIIGGGMLRESLSRQIEELRLTEYVILTGPLARHEVMDRIRSAAVVAVPCIVGDDGNRDGLPTVLLEAMALGTPCIATDVTGIPELVRDGDTGVIVSQRNPMALAESIERLLDDRSLGVELAARGRQLIESSFDIHKNTTEMREVFDAAAGSASKTLVEVA